GAFFHNSNDFDDGFRQTAQAPEVSYVLSFSPADVKMDGKFHALKVTVDGGFPVDGCEAGTALEVRDEHEDRLPDRAGHLPDSRGRARYRDEEAGRVE